jgi:hypothetical protein
MTSAGEFWCLRSSLCTSIYGGSGGLQPVALAPEDGRVDLEEAPNDKASPTDIRVSLYL